MARGYTDPNLPDGIVKLPPEPGSSEPGCSLRGCLYGVMVLFALLLAAMVIIALFRVWHTPVGVP